MNSAMHSKAEDRCEKLQCLNCRLSQIETFVCRAHRGHQAFLTTLGGRRFGHDIANLKIWQKSAQRLNVTYLDTV